MFKPSCGIVIMALGLVCFGTAFCGATEPRNNRTAIEQKLQERVGQRTGAGMPGRMPMAPRTEFAGALVEHNRLRAQPGYVLELLPGNRVVAKRVGGGSGGTWDVKCAPCSKKGKCKLEHSGSDSIICLGECTGTCAIDVRPAGGGKLLLR
jgi:hypothetical protein